MRRIRARVPPDTLLPGPHPSHAAPGLLGGQRVLARPISRSTCKAVRLASPSSCLRSPPGLVVREVCTSKRTGLRRRARHRRPGGEGGEAAAPSGTHAWRPPARCAAHARHCGARKSSCSSAGGPAKRGAARPWPVTAWALVPCSGGQRLSREVAKTGGARSPASIARMLVMPGWPVIARTPSVHVRCICSRAFCLGGPARAASATRRLRCRRERRHPQTSSAGRTAPRRQP